jgi:hypothetical protein
MLLQVIQNTDSLDALTQTTGQDQTGLFLLIAVSSLVVIIIIWILVRKGVNKQQRGTISKQSVPKTPLTDTKSTTISTIILKPTEKAKEPQKKKELTEIETEKPKAEKEEVKKEPPEQMKPKIVEPKPEEQSQLKYIGYNCKRQFTMY